MNLTDEYIEVDGEKCHVLRGMGSGGLPILFLHGWGSKAENYRRAVSFFPGNFPEFVIPDMPGFGQSSLPKSTWGIEEYAAWVWSLIELLGWSKLIVAGHSFGGRITIYMATKHTEKIHGIVLYGAAGISKRNHKKLAALNYVAKFGKKIMVLPVFRVFRPLAEKALYHAIGNTDYLYAGEKKAIFKKVISEDLTKLLKKIRVPTKLLWGRNDQATPLADALLMHEIIPESELTVIDGAGHNMHTQDPERFAVEFVKIIREMAR